MRAHRRRRRRRLHQFRRRPRPSPTPPRTDMQPSEEPPADIAPAPEPPPPAPEPAPPAPAPIERTARFGSPGVFVFSSDASLGLGVTARENSANDAFYLSVAPGFDWFIARHLSVGIELFAVYVYDPASSGDHKTTSLGGGPRFGFDMPIGRSVSIYPRLAVGLEQVERGSISHGGPWIDAYAPVLAHLGQGFFIGAGPSVFHSFSSEKSSDLSLGGQRTFVRAHVTFGAW